MMAALDRWNEERNAQGEAPLVIGIGLNYGPVVLGDVGSEHSMSFTVIGDTVNTASRLQELTRSLKTSLVIGDALVRAAQAAASDLAVPLLDRLQDRGERVLRGRVEAVRIWTRDE
jgi:adenylate cyclase